MKKQRPKFNNKKDKHLINDRIYSTNVRLVGENGSGDVISKSEAMEKATALGLDLICINPNQRPPIVIIDDYSKYVYNEQKKEKERTKTLKKNASIKETKLSINISDHDLEIKAQRSLEFLKKGNKVKCTLQMKGRENHSPERGKIVMFKFAEMIEEFGIPESMPSREGNRWTMIFKPKK